MCIRDREWEEPYFNDPNRNINPNAPCWNSYSCLDDVISHEEDEEDVPGDRQEAEELRQAIRDSRRGAPRLRTPF